MSDRYMITCRVPDEMRRELDDIARKRRQASGDQVTRSALMVEAIEAFIRKERRKA
jgi:predicted transcriptional regulator